jgi:transcriptional regulator with XRE-family HTH domain
MPRTIPPPLSVALAFLRTERGWTQKELALAAGMSVKVLSFYERGRTHLSRALLETIVSWMGHGPDAIDAALFALQQIRPAREESDAPNRPTEPERRAIERVAAVTGRDVADFTRAELVRQAHLLRLQQARQKADKLWDYLRNLPARDRRLLVENGKEYKSWALAVRLCEESSIAAAADAARAVELAELAVRIAEITPSEGAFRERLLSFAWAFLGNARRVAGDLPAADLAFGRSGSCRVGGTPALTDPDPLEDWRVFDLEASLRREQRRWDEALRLHDQAMAAAPAKDRGRILIKKSVTLEQSGDHDRAITTLSHAAQNVEAQREPRLGFALHANLALNLCRLGRFTEAEKLLPKARRLAVQLGNGLDLVRLRWVEGITAAGLGRRVEAAEALSFVRIELSSQGIAYDAALVTMELAVLYLEEARHREVKVLARQIAPVFHAQGVHREVLAAIKLFSDAAEREEATTELARRLVEFLHLARYDSTLRFGKLE